MSKTPRLTIPIPETCYPSLKTAIGEWAIMCHVPEIVFGAELIKDIHKWGYPYFRAGMLVHNPEGKILMMHESRVLVRKIKDEAERSRWLAAGKSPDEWVDGDGGWNLPSGRLRTNGEDFENAAIRRVKDECGWSVDFESLFLLRHSEAPKNRYFMPVYLARSVSGPIQYQTWGTSGIGWFTVEEIWRMKLANQLRSPEFVMESANAFLCQGIICPQF